MKGRLISITVLLTLISCEEPIKLVAPTNLIFTRNGEKSITLVWEGNNDQEDGFSIERKKGNGNYTHLTSKPAGSTSHTDSGLVINESYGYQVRATGGSNNSEWSNELLVSVFLNAPAYLSLTRDDVTTYTITWTDNSGYEDGYSVERKIRDGSFELLASKPAGSTTHVDSGLTIDETYTYRVKATSPEGDSDYSYERTITSTFFIDPPRNLAILRNDETTISLEWEDRSDEENGFRVERKVGATDYVLLASMPAGSTTYTDSGLTINETYSYRVKATCHYKDSEWSDEQSISINFMVQAI